MAADVILDMACSCGPGRLAEDACVARVTAAIGPLRVAFVTEVLDDLLIQPGGVARIDVVADQWFGVSAHLTTGERIFLPADEVEHALARLWEWVHEHRRG